jgi:hypothetical protein
MRQEFIGAGTYLTKPSIRGPPQSHETFRFYKKKNYINKNYNRTGSAKCFHVTFKLKTTNLFKLTNKDIFGLDTGS